MRRNGIIILIMVITALVGAGALIFGYYLTDHDILSWLCSKWAITVYIAVGLILLFSSIILIKEAIRKL